ncbi:M12 family metallo-peptidase [Cellulosimicrobium cellulans]|uniref:M12 family metallo-peptidase n=1 Tax=Cellulosimicrobium cellulans TaxID=1710 RepID=UPI003656C5CD
MNSSHWLAWSAAAGAQLIRPPLAVIRDMHHTRLDQIVGTKGARQMGASGISRSTGWRRIAAAVASLAMALGFVAATAPAASAYNLTGCKWPRAIIGYRADAMTGNFGTSASSTVSSWNSLSDVDLRSAPGTTLRLYTQNDGNNGYAGWSTWSCTSGTTTAATARLNTYITTSYVANKKRTVWAHEIGHAIGLSHANAGTMMYTCPPCTYDTYGRYVPQTDDRNGANSLY